VEHHRVPHAVVQADGWGTVQVQRCEDVGGDHGFHSVVGRCVIDYMSSISM